jgi:hypothetical protein
METVNSYGISLGKVKAELSLLVIKHYAMETYAVVEV